MIQRSPRFISSSSLLLVYLALVGGCGRTAGDEPRQPQHAGAGVGGGKPIVSEGARGGMASSGGSGGAPVLSLGGALSEPPEPGKPSKPAGTCRAADLPGSPCQEAQCWSSRCGVHFQLACQAGTWVIEGSALAFEMVCQPEDEFIYAIRDLTAAACCNGWRPRDELGAPPSCELCPAEAPRDGDPCSLPDDCSPRISDCFYDCCCYGTTTWAQCDGERWHVPTDCSSK